MITHCAIDGMHISECSHIPCKDCGSTLRVCAGCWKCGGCHDDESDCEEWLIGVEVMGVLFEAESEGDD